MALLQEDLHRLRFWRALVAEFLGTMFLVLFGCGAWVHGDHDDSTAAVGPDAVRIAFAFTLTYVAVLYCLRSVAEGHINPAVTVALMITRRSSVVRSLLYLLSQVLGALLGAAIVLGLTPSEHRANNRAAVGLTLIRTDVSTSQGFGVEFLATFFFVFVVVACLEKNRREEAVAAPVIIGLTYGAVTLFAIPYTGGSVNPARSFGPALVTGIWTDHWIYWFAPLLGGVMGGLTYDAIFSTRSSFTRMRTCLLAFYQKDKDPERGEHEINDEEEEAEEERRKREESEDDGVETVVLNSSDPQTSLDEEGGLEPRQGMRESKV